MCYYSVRSSGYLHLGCSTDSVVLWVLKRHFRRHGLIVETGTILTVQHLMFSVEESASLALLETVVVYYGR